MISNSGAGRDRAQPRRRRLSRSPATPARTTAAASAGDEFIDLTFASVNSGIVAPAITVGTAVDGDRNGDRGGARRRSGSSRRTPSTEASGGSSARRRPRRTATGRSPTRPSSRSGQRVTATHDRPGPATTPRSSRSRVRTGLRRPEPDGVPRERPRRAARRSTDTTPTFEFSSNVSTATFECRFDAAAFTLVHEPVDGDDALRRARTLRRAGAGSGPNVSPGAAAERSSSTRPPRR